MPIQNVNGVRLVVLPKYNEAALAAWREFVDSDSIFGLDVETTAIPFFEGSGKSFGPAVARADYRVPGDVPASFVKRGYTPGSKQAVRVREIQFGSKTEGWVFDAQDEDWRPHVEALLSDPTKRFVSHNADFDTTRVLYHYGIRLGTRSIDTLVMADMVFPGRTAPTQGRSKGLKELCAWCLDDPTLAEAEKALHARFADLYPRVAEVPKNFEPGVSPCRNCKDEPSWPGSIRGFGKECYDAAVGLNQTVKDWGWDNIALDDPVFTRYAGLDAVNVRRLLDWLGTELQRKHMAALSRDEQRVKRLMTHRSNRGMRVDVEWTREVLAEVSAEFEQAETEVLERTGCKARSPKLKTWLAEHGCRTSSLDKDHRPGLLIRFERDEEVGPVLRAYDAAMTNTNLLGNLATILRHAEGGNGFVHPQINTMQAHTTRMSVRGPAMQTLAKDGLKGERLRGCFIARPGHVLVGADWDNQETRIGAALSGDVALNRIVAENLNQHVLTAESIFPEVFVNKVESPVEYHQAKTLDFAQQYGAGPKKIALSLGIPEAAARNLWLAWRETYAGLVEWSEEIALKSYIRNPFGQIIPADEYGRAYANGNYAIQSTGRGMLGKALCALADAGWGSAVWLPVHDEIVLETPEERAEKAAAALTEAMTMHLPKTPWAPIKSDVVIPATGEIIGDRWRGLK